MHKHLSLSEPLARLELATYALRIFVYLQKSCL
nr:MAG TPA_asm: hypothetical protein [Caudoviricetes sp.]